MLKTNRILFIFLFITTSVIAQKNFTLEQVILESSSLMPTKLNQLQWIPGTDDFAYVESSDEGDNLIKENSDSEGKETILTLSNLDQAVRDAGLATIKSFPRFKWISDSSFRFWHHQTLVEYDLTTNSILILNSIADNGVNSDYIVPNKIAYTIDNNLYIAVNSKQIQITNDENKGIVNGQTVHRVEFGIDKGTFWSPNSNYLAFYRKDEIMVTDYPVLDISKKPAVTEYIKYPMAGMTSEEVTVGVYDLKSEKIIWLKTGEPKDHYLPGVTWSPDERFIYINELNRDQNHLKLTKYDVKTGDLVNVLFEETNDKYVEPMHGPIFFENEPDIFIWNSRNDGWNRLFLYDAQGRKIRTLTKGDWDVTDFDGFDSYGLNIYFTATEQGPIERHYYRISLDTGEMSRITNGSGNHNVIKNDNGTKFLDVFDNLNIPYEVKIVDRAGETIRPVYSAPNPFDEYNIGKTEIFKFKSADGYDLYCRQILPPQFEKNKKYPVLVYVYGGPHAQLVRNTWLGGADFWLNYMAQNEFIVFTLDNRGSYNRGLEFEQKTFRRLGTVEIEDQMVGVNYLKSLSFVDSTRLGVYGWSFGGFMTAGLMTRTPGVFKVGVAGGAVTDWRYYEVMYTERYMDTPEMNPEGYQETSLLNYVKDLKGTLLLVHGTSDPTVVWQHTLLFSEHAMHLGIDLDYFPYVSHKHGIRGNDRFHLYQKITNYFLNNL